MSDKSVEVIYDFLAVHASLKGDKLAAIEGDINLTYAAPQPKVDRLATALLAETPKPTREEAIAWMSANICRCTGYTLIIDAVMEASGQ